MWQTLSFFVANAVLIAGVTPVKADLITLQNGTGTFSQTLGEGAILTRTGSGR